eukprot:2749386-Rhodomonas_salina.1
MVASYARPVPHSAPALACAPLLPGAPSWTIAAYTASVPDIAQHTLRSHRTLHSMPVGRYQHTVCQYRTWRSERVR